MLSLAKVLFYPNNQSYYSSFIRELHKTIITN